MVESVRAGSLCQVADEVVELADVSASRCEWVIAESTGVKVVRSPSESIVVSVVLSSCRCGRCKAEKVREVSRCSW